MAYAFYQWSPYVAVAERRRKAQRKIASLAKRGFSVDPVSIEGRKIARTFWGKAWCDNLESYSDYENRLPRGRTYVRNGSVIDLKIEPGQVTAMVSGSSIYEVQIAIEPAAKARWRALARECAGKIDSVVELLQGKLSKGVMQILARRDTGLFPAPREISFECSCPDWAIMCKHVAAVLHGVGARLDHSPEMLFVLRQVDHLDLVAQAGSDSALGEISGAAKGQVLDAAGLSDIFGIELEGEPSAAPAPTRAPKRAGKKPAKSRASKPKKRTKQASGKPAPSRAAGSKTRKKIPARTSRAGATGRPRADSKRAKKRSREITARELIDLGLPRSTFQNWLTSGVLIRTDRRGCYLQTAAAKQRIKRALRARRRKKR